MATEYYVVYNLFTDSPVTHGEAWVTVVWETKRQAFDHALSLTTEYRAVRDDTPDNRNKFRWGIRPATVEECIAAKDAGIFGAEWGDILGTVPLDRMRGRSHK
jgi:hypothetical protein